MDYTSIESKAFADDSLSFKAKGMLYTITRSEGELDTQDKIMKTGSDGIHAIRKGICELMDHGYLRFEMQRRPDGKIARRRYVLVEQKEEK